MSLADLTLRIERANAAIKEEETAAKARMAGLIFDRDELIAEREHLVAGTDPGVRLLATHVVSIRGNIERLPHIEGNIVEAAIRDLSAGAPKLRVEYLGAKDYEGFLGQREDHQYSFGPRHGHIIFAIELMPEVRKRLSSGGELTAEEKEAAIHYLMNLERAGVA